MKLALVKGATSQTVLILLEDSSSSTGAGKTGLAFNTASLTAYYARPRVAAAAITLATQTVTGAFISGGFVEIDATNMPGLYRLDIPDAALASGVDSVVIALKGASNMAPVTLEIQLTNFNLNAASPDVTADAAAIRVAIGLAAANLDAQLTTIDDFLDTEVAAIKAKTDNLPASPAATGAAMTLTTGERDSVADALLDRADAVETAITPRLAFRYIAAACAGKLAGAATATEVFAGVGVATTRLTATVDSSGNRTAVALG